MGRGFRAKSYGVGLWTTGFKTKPSGPSGERLERLTEWETVIKNLTDQRFGNLYGEEYSETLRDIISSSEDAAKAMRTARLSSRWTQNGGLHARFKEVALLIKTREMRKVDRDIFYISASGWDHHSNVKQRIPGKFRYLNDVFHKFVAELKAQNMWKQVAVFTTSEFGRTITPNGNRGVDHGFSSQHLLFGGSVNGGQIFNRYPSLDLTSANPFAWGRSQVAQAPWESMMVPIAKWLGVTDSDGLQNVFPNYRRFNSTHTNEDVIVFAEA